MTQGIQQLIWAIERVRDAFHEAVYVTGDVDAAVAATVPECVLTAVPVDAGVRGHDELRRHLTEVVLPHLPADLTFERVTRTSDQRRVVQESTVSFTHDRELPWLLPGVAPTHRRAEVLAISVVSFKHRSHLGVTESRITTHRTLWDHSGLLAQLGLDPSEVATARPAAV